MIYVASSWRNPRYEGILDALTQWNIAFYNWRDEEGFHWSDVMQAELVCTVCHVEKSKCLPGGRYYTLCPFSKDGSDHVWSGSTDHWTTPIPPYQFISAMEHERSIAGFQRDMNHLRDAEAVILLLPCGKSAHLEAGWAAGAGKPLALYAPEPLQPELMYGMMELITADIHLLMKWAKDKTQERILA